jgi:hypothetical protein
VQKFRSNTLVFNVGGNSAAAALEKSAEDFETLWRRNALGGFLVGRLSPESLTFGGITS